MNCERCGEHLAKLRYTEVREGKTHTLHICEECARELGFGQDPAETAGPAPEPPDPPESPEPSSPPAKIVFGILASQGSASKAKESEGALPGEEYAAVRCPGCGITGAELRDRTLLGCPTCYETFAKPLDDLLLRLHAALDHKGRLPGGREAAPPDPKELHRRLREAIEREDFEEAARLRNRLRRIRGEPE